MPNFQRSDFNTAVSKRASGSYTDANFNSIANEAVKEVLADLDLRSTIRKSLLTPNLFDEVFRYTCPTDLKQDKVIDIQPQVDRHRLDHWTLTTQEEFDRWKNVQRLDRYGDPIELDDSIWMGKNLVAIERDDMTNKLLLSRVIDDDELGIDTLDSVGDWAGYGDGENLTADSGNYIEGSGCINWDINADGGTTAGIYNDSLDTFDISDYITNGYIFVWVYLSDATDVTNFIIRIGSGASNYYSVTITTNNEGNSFEDGWNLLRFDFSNASETGTVVTDACDYIASYMTKDAAKVSETDYRFDDLRIKLGDYYYVEYYSKFGWQTSGGSWQLESSADTDYLNAESDEYQLIQLKTLQMVEEHLSNLERAQYWEQRYAKRVAKYRIDNPSQAIVLSTTYHTL